MRASTQRLPFLPALAGWGSPPITLLPKPMLAYFTDLASAGEKLPDPPEGYLPLSPLALGPDCWTNIKDASSIGKQLEELAVFYAKIAFDAVARTELCPRLHGVTDTIQDRLWLRKRSYNVCADAGFVTLGDLSKVTYAHLRSRPTCGTLTLLDIACALEALDAAGVQELEEPQGVARPRVPTTEQVLIEAAAESAPRVGGRATRLLEAAALPQTWAEPHRSELGRSLSSKTAAEFVRSATNDASPAMLCEALLLSFKERSRSIFSGRFLARRDRPTLEELGVAFGVTRERIRQIESKVQRQLERALVSEEHLPLRRCAAAIRVLIGAAVPIEEAEAFAVTICPDALVTVSESEISVLDILLWLSGPFVEKQGWLVANTELFGRAKQALLSSSENSGFVSDDNSAAILADLGIRDRWARRFVIDLECMRSVPGGWVAAHGSLVNQCISWIRYKNQPVNIEELARVTGTESERSLRARLFEDARVKRINKQSDFALAEWSQFDKYTGIAEEIAQEIKACGGAASVEHLVSKIAPLYGVKPSSVRQYASAPMFYQGADRLVRVRGDGDRLIVEADPSDNVGCYFVRDAWLFRFEVNSETLRGSGRPVPNGYAVALGCQPGMRHSIETLFGDVTVSWPSTTAAGPNIGSLRHITDACALNSGDWIFFGRGASGSVVTTLRKAKLEEETDPVAQALLLMGFGDNAAALAKRADVWDEIVSALGSADVESNATANDVRRALHARGESVLELYIKPAAEESRDEAISRIVDLLG